jgi:type IV pilus assembly protein PilB
MPEQKLPEGESAQHKVIKPTDEDRKLFEKRQLGKKYRYRNTPALGVILEEAGLINEEMIREVLKSGDESAQSLKRSLIDQGLVREEDILDALAQEMGMEKIDLTQLKPTPDLIHQIDAGIAKKYQVFPVRYDDNTLYVALADPLNIQATDDLERIVGKKVIGVIASEEDILRMIKHYYETGEIAELYEDFTEESTNVMKPFREYKEIELQEELPSEQPPTVRFVDLVFRQAVHERASDIHIEPQRTRLAIRFRVDGVLRDVPSPPKRWQNAIISRLKVLSGLDLSEKRVPQDGHIRLKLPEKRLDLRVSCMPSIYGETIVMRLLDQSTFLMSLEEVGFLPDNIELFKNMIKAPNGIILMTGPTGCGKTTTLYAAMSYLNNVETKIITVESPVEYQIDGINQIQVNEDIGLTYATGLRALLRQSPNVILVGEIRDLDTAEIAIRAALTGHLVFSTLHTNDASSAAIRLLNLGAKPFLVASSIQAVIAQRLIRKLCNYCKQPYTPRPEEIIAYGYEPAKYENATLYRPAGCERCGESGYRGRTAIHEIFLLDPVIRQMVTRYEAATRLKKTAVRQGMRTLRDDAWEKVLMGLTGVEEMLRVTQTD